MAFKRFTDLCNRHHTNFRIFSLLQKETLCSLASPGPHSLISPWQPLIYFLCLWICVFWIFHTNRLIGHVVYCERLLSLSVPFLRFIHVVAYISTLFLFMADLIFHCGDMVQCVLSPSVDGGLCGFHFGAQYYFLGFQGTHDCQK